MAARATTTTATGPTQEQTLSEIAYLTRALKAPTLRNSVQRLADRARAEAWTHTGHVEAVLNLYGPTEDTTYSTHARLLPLDPRSACCCRTRAATSSTARCGRYRWARSGSCTWPAAG